MTLTLRAGVSLKPCPFCGGEADIEQTGPKEITVRCVGVQQSGLRGCGPMYRQKTLRQPLDWLADLKAAAWNRRALSECISSGQPVVAEEGGEWPVPAGWKLVPIEPTAEMSQAGARAIAGYLKKTDEGCYATDTAEMFMWDAMLAAAPPPPRSKLEG